MKNRLMYIMSFFLILSSCSPSSEVFQVGPSNEEIQAESSPNKDDTSLESSLSEPFVPEPSNAPAQDEIKADPKTLTASLRLEYEDSFDAPEKIIEGKVIDEQQQPVAGVKIKIIQLDFGSVIVTSKKSGNYSWVTAESDQDEIEYFIHMVDEQNNPIGEPLFIKYQKQYASLYPLKFHFDKNNLDDYCRAEIGHQEVLEGQLPILWNAEKRLKKYSPNNTNHYSKFLPFRDIGEFNSTKNDRRLVVLNLWSEAELMSDGIFHGEVVSDFKKAQKFFKQNNFLDTKPANITVLGDYFYQVEFQELHGPQILPEKDPQDPEANCFETSKLEFAGMIRAIHYEEDNEEKEYYEGGGDISVTLQGDSCQKACTIPGEWSFKQFEYEWDNSVTGFKGDVKISAVPLISFPDGPIQLIKKKGQKLGFLGQSNFYSLSEKNNSFFIDKTFPVSRLEDSQDVKTMKPIDKIKETGNDCQKGVIDFEWVDEKQVIFIHRNTCHDSFDLTLLNLDSLKITDQHSINEQFTSIQHLQFKEKSIFVFGKITSSDSFDFEMLRLKDGKLTYFPYRIDLPQDVKVLDGFLKNDFLYFIIEANHQLDGEDDDNFLPPYSWRSGQFLLEVPIVDGTLLFNQYEIVVPFKYYKYLFLPSDLKYIRMSPFKELDFLKLEFQDDEGEKNLYALDFQQAFETNLEKLKIDHAEAWEKLKRRVPMSMLQGRKRIKWIHYYTAYYQNASKGHPSMQSVHGKNGYIYDLISHSNKSFPVTNVLIEVSYPEKDGVFNWEKDRYERYEFANTDQLGDSFLYGDDFYFSLGKRIIKVNAVDYERKLKDTLN